MSLVDLEEFADRSVYVLVHLDTNRINSRQKLATINQLERWYADGVIELEMSEVAQQEALAGRSASRTRKALGYLATETLASTEAERHRLKQIERVIFPSGIRDQTEKNDVEIVFNADKYHAVLVTDDGASATQPRGILGSRVDLAKIGIRVLTSEEIVAHVRLQIDARDRLVREGCRRFQFPLPEWVGRD